MFKLSRWVTFIKQGYFLTLFFSYDSQLVVGENNIVNGGKYQ